MILGGDGETPPLYRKLRDLIAADIAARFWNPGDAIAAEAQLAATHTVAISTVRRAIDLLVLEGLLVRVQGAGTFVRKPDFETASVRFIRCHGSADDRGTPKSRILHQAVLDASVRDTFRKMAEQTVQPCVGARALTEALMTRCLPLRQHLGREDRTSPLFAAL